MAAEVPPRRRPGERRRLSRAHGCGACRVEVDERRHPRRPADGDVHDAGEDLLSRPLVEGPGPVAVQPRREAGVDDRQDVSGRTDVVEVLRLELPEDPVGARPLEDESRGAGVVLRDRQRHLVRRGSRERDDGSRRGLQKGVLEPRTGRGDVAVLHPHPELVDDVGRLQDDRVARRGRLGDDREPGEIRAVDGRYRAHDLVDRPRRGARGGVPGVGDLPRELQGAAHEAEVGNRVPRRTRLRRRGTRREQPENERGTQDETQGRHRSGSFHLDLHEPRGRGRSAGAQGSCRQRVHA